MNTYLQNPLPELLASPLAWAAVAMMLAGVVAVGIGKKIRRDLFR